MFLAHGQTDVAQAISLRKNQRNSILLLQAVTVMFPL